MRATYLLIAIGAAAVAVPALADHSIDGTGNNFADLTLGATGTDQIRLTPNAYADGLGVMRTVGPSGALLPSARSISNAVATQGSLSGNERNLTSMFWQWGQFIDHDLVLTNSGGDFAPIIAPAGDPVFAPGTMIPFTRSLTTNAPGTERSMANNITHWLDGSAVYGSDATRQAALRSFTGGRLATSGIDMMPLNTAGLDVGNDSQIFPDSQMYLGGDPRATEQTGLIAMHTLMVREHNRWADRLTAELDLTGMTPEQADQRVYDAARSIVAAQTQKITYEEWLPAMLGGANMSSLGLDSYSGYDASVDPSISLEFSTAAFRFGHTMLNEQLLRFNADGTVFDGGHLTLRDAFFDPTTLDTPEEMDAIFRGLAAQEAEAFDARVVDSARSFLFGAPGSGAGGLDLMAANIQRGRDHGLGTYNEIRQSLGLLTADTFLDLTGGDQERADALAAVYASVDDVDFIVGMLIEPKLDGASVGETVAMILGDQFSRLRDADRFFYLNGVEIDPELASYLAEATSLTLGDIIALNTGVEGLQSNVFFIPAPGAAGVLGAMGLLALRRRRG